MGAALFIVPEREIEGFDHFVNGKFVGRESDRKIDQLCKTAGVKSLYDFCSQNPDELADLAEDFGVDLPEEVPTEVFFEAAEGLATVRGMLDALSSGESPLENTEGVVADLKEYETVLARLDNEGIRWHMQVDF